MNIRQTDPVFEENVRLKYQLYNSLFLTLPFDLIHETGNLLPLLSAFCEKGFQDGQSPEQILNSFFNEYLEDADANTQAEVLFNFIKYIERQVVLFDAVEEAAFHKTHDLNGEGTIVSFFKDIKETHTGDKLVDKLRDYRLRIVLTAHPTQFYPGTVLGIITDLAKAIRNNDVVEVKTLLLQLGKTPFINQTQPTPLDEAKSLIWYLKNIFYSAVSNVVYKINEGVLQTTGTKVPDNFIQLGFWPGGDRDGNPYVTPQITRKTMSLLHQAIINCYYEDLHQLRRRITFKGVYDELTKIEYKLYENVQQHTGGYRSANELTHDLNQIHQLIISQHDGLFADQLIAFQSKVNLFGFHFATLDIRQDSRKHEALIHEILRKNQLFEKFESSSLQEKIDILLRTDIHIEEDDTSDETSKDIIGSLKAIVSIQKDYGESACHRYIISNTRNALDVIMVWALSKWSTGKVDHLDIIPLFESIDSLKGAENIMDMLYGDDRYTKHLKARSRTQTIMLGFSDGTKDGGYLQANWSIFKAKETLTAQARKHHIRVIFFDGRGGPPARGGGNTHKFYSSLGPTVDNHEVQLTIQGQTISSNFGSTEIAAFNLEQLFTAGLSSILQKHQTPLSKDESELLSRMAEVGYNKYIELKESKEFLHYLEEVGTLDYFGKTNIGSRPVKRGGGSALTLDQLRAIPFVSSWSQLKQNVPGYYGFGFALDEEARKGNEEEVKSLYQRSRFFQTLVGNSMQSLSKSFFPLTAYLQRDPELGAFWKDLYEEYLLSVERLLEVSGQQVLLEDAPANQHSISLRESIILPVLTIQQAAIQKLRKGELSDELISVYHKLILRTMYGIINASRNSA